MKKFILSEELWPKKYSEEIGEKFETEIVMKSRVRDWMAAEHPTEFQLKDASYNVCVFTFNHGEKSKNLNTFMEIQEYLVHLLRLK